MIQDRGETTNTWLLIGSWFRVRTGRQPQTEWQGSRIADILPRPRRDEQHKSISGFTWIMTELSFGYSKLHYAGIDCGCCATWPDP